MTQCKTIFVTFSKKTITSSILPFLDLSVQRGVSCSKRQKNACFIIFAQFSIQKNFKNLYTAIMSILKFCQKYPQDDRIDRKLENISFLQVFLLPRANV